jgi:glycosyltransferase involved in cell wall biosynthesis
MCVPDWFERTIGVIVKKIIFLGYVVPPEEAEGSVAGNKMQWNTVRQLSALDDVQVVCVTVTPMTPFPHNKTIRYKSQKATLFPGVDNHRVAFWNLPVIKQFSQIVGVYRTAKRLVRKFGADTLLCFNLFPQIGIPMKWLKRKFSKLDTVCLLADLPIDDTPDRKGFSRILRAMMDSATWKSMQKCDRYVALNENAMKTYLPGKPYIIVDGGIDPDEFPKTLLGWNGKEKNIIYTGALVDYSGIMNLIAAMDLIEDKSIVLDIYGDGVLKPEVERIAGENSRIRYHGRVSNQEAMQAQQSAWLLANPRPVMTDIAQVTFPSKIFEYLMSGRPVMTTRLNGFSEDYDSLLFWVEGDSPEALAGCINSISKYEDDALTCRARSAREYLLKHKTWEHNAHRIYQFLLDTLGEKHEPRDE